MKDIITGILLLFTTSSCIYFWKYLLEIITKFKIKEIGEKKVKND